MHRSAVHRLGRRRRLRRRLPGRRAVRLPAARGPRRRAGRPAAVRRHHRLPGPALRRRPARRAAGHLRLRRQRPPHGAGRARPGHAGARAHPRRAQPAAGPRARRRLRRRRRRRGTGAAGRRDPLRARPATWCRWRCGRWTRCDPRRRRHLAVGHPALDYADELFQERRLRSVTANTRRDGEELLRLAVRLGVRATTTSYSMDEAPRALADLAAGRFGGTAVLHT